MGRRLPRRIGGLYPTVIGLEQLGLLQAILNGATPLLRALVQEKDLLTLPASRERVTIAPGVELTPPGAYLRPMTEAHGSLVTELKQGGGGKTLIRVRTNSAGKRRLYELGRQEAR